MMSSAIPQTSHPLNGCNPASDIPTQQSSEVQSIQTSDSVSLVFGFKIYIQILYPLIGTEC